MQECSLILGIDIGTSKVAAVIIDSRREVLGSVSMLHGARQAGSGGGGEQDMGVLFAVAREVVTALPESLRRCIGAVGLTGQMHGVVVVDEKMNPLGPLITWQDERCDEGFLAELNRLTGHRLRTGFGCASLAWLAHHGALPGNAVSAGTVHDVVAARLCGLERCVMDPTDAASWGLFDLREGQWDEQGIRAAGIAPAVLPQVVPCGFRAGVVTDAQAREFGIRAGVPVAAAIGDCQAAMLATLTRPEKQLALILGTGGQLSAVVPASVGPEQLGADAAYEYRPYTEGRFALVAACLCGGSAWEWLVENIRKWFGELGVAALPREQVYCQLNELGLQSAADLDVRPSFLGERHDPGRSGSIAGIRMENFGLADMAGALARGIIENLKTMLPEQALVGRDEVIGSGNALAKNPLLQSMVEEVLGLPLQLRADREEAGIGAAINALALKAELP